MVDIVTGEVKGRHDGLMYYTLGQRQGLGIGGSGNGEPWFVADKNLEKNQLLVVQGDAHASLYSTGLTATGVNWIAGAERTPNVPFRCTAKFRYRQPDQGVTLTWQRTAVWMYSLINSKSDHARTSRCFLRRRGLPWRWYD